MYGTKRQIISLVVCFFFAVAANAYNYDPNDFALEVIEYVEGTGVGSDWLTGEPFNNANTALGGPTLETTGDGYNINPLESVPVVPVYPTFRAFEIVTIGNDGYLILKFNHRVSDDKNNPYGIDFIIFGNARQSSNMPWVNGNPENITLTNSFFSEPGIVSVSQDGNDWYSFSAGPYADSFAPTASYMWDDVNDVWADELDPTKPVKLSLSVSGMAGKTVAEMIDKYDGSAGGTGFDLNDLDPCDYTALAIDPNTGRKWIQYILIEDNPSYGSATTEIDAVSDVSGCGDYKHPFPIGDLNEDCRVDYQDVELMCYYWLADTSNPNDPAIIADIYEDEDNTVNFYDWTLIAENWLKCTWECE